MRLAAATLLACGTALFGGCGHAPGYPPNPMLRPSAVTDFTTLYGQNCAACHGANGQNGASIDLANPEYQALADDATLRKWISGGMPGTEMPAFARSDGGMLTEAQVNVLIAGMRKRWSHANVFAGVLPPPYAQAPTGDVQAGEQSYQARCGGCHAPSRQQITAPDYLAIVGNQALRTLIIAGRPDIGQPDWRHDSPNGTTTSPLSPQEVDDIVAYLASLRNPGTTPQAANDASGRPAATTPARR